MTKAKPPRDGTLCTCAIDYFLNEPTTNSIADSEKINGHNLNAMKSILKPVNSDRIAIDTSIMNDNA
jgi:hypothetical protein